MRIPIRFDSLSARVSSLLLIPPAAAFIDLTEAEVEIRMGWAFRARFPRSAIQRAVPVDQRRLSRGVHGWAGRWLVNGAGDGIVRIDLAPEQQATVMGFAVRLRQLSVSVSDATTVADMLSRGAERS